MVVKDYLDLLSGSAKLKPTHLTKREYDVFRLAAQGKSNKEIAFEINLSPDTVYVHQSNIKKKIGF
jgi:DNA-binding NarL/FixJ family response regulator